MVLAECLVTDVEHAVLNRPVLAVELQQTTCVGLIARQAGDAANGLARGLAFARHAIGIHSGWKVRLIGNELSRPVGMPPVVMVFHGAKADFLDNTVRGNGVAGIRTEEVVRATGNTFESPTLRAGGTPQFAVWGLPGSSIVFIGNTVRGWRHGLFADKATVTANENRIANYGHVRIKITQPTTTAVIVGNRIESETAREGGNVTGGQAIVENNRVEKPKATGVKDTAPNKPQ